MSTDERARHELHLAAERALGTSEAATLMAALPPAGWGDVATKADFAAHRAVLHAEMEGLKTELRGEMGELRAELRGEMSGLRAELRGEMGELRAELRGEMRDLRTELVGAVQTQRFELLAALEARVGAATRTILLALIGLMLTTWAAMAGLVLTR